VVVLRSGALRDSLAALIPVAPWLVFGGGMLLGWRFNRSQLLLALLVLVVADRALVHVAGASAPVGSTARVVFTCLAVLLPLDLAALAWTTERSRQGPAGRWLLGALVSQPLAVALVARPELSHVAKALERRLVGEGGSWTPVSQPAILVFVAALGLIAAGFLSRQTITQSSLAWAVVAAFLALHAGAPPASTAYLTTAGLILVVSLIETSHHMAYDDELTGLPGRRALGEALARLGGQYAIAMVDIDHFKRFNDEHGHATGDQLLRMVGTRLTEIDGGGRPFRYGGEEFAVLFPGTTVEEALPHLERFRQTIERSSFTLRGRDRPRRKPKTVRPTRHRRRVAVTVSIGVAEPGSGRLESEDVVKAADTALYRAKHAGRNRTCSAG
jgi:diguanylate cyclase (GGDEF)-like protein